METEFLISSIVLDKTGSLPLYQQVAEAIAACIAQGSLSADQKLPPIRKLSGQLGVNVVTIVTAYKYLEQKQLVYSRRGSGTFVSPVPVERIPQPVANRNLHLFESGLLAENAMNCVPTTQL